MGIPDPVSFLGGWRSLIPGPFPGDGYVQGVGGHKWVGMTCMTGDGSPTPWTWTRGVGAYG